MLVFEYTRRTPIEPTSLINEAPSIWRWTNPYMGISSWMYDIYGVPFTVDESRIEIYNTAFKEEVPMTTVPDYATMVATENSFFWDNTGQIAYFNFGLEHPHALSSLSLSKLFGATDQETKVFNGVLYPNILLNRPSVNREVEPVTYTRLAIQSITIEMVNDKLYKMVDDRPVAFWRFDDLVNAEELIAGQATTLKYWEEGMEYADMPVLHKGIIEDCTVSPTRIQLVCADKRSKTDLEWPTLTYRNLGYTEANVGEDELDNVVPDGFGHNREMPLTCVNRDECLIAKDEDDNIILPSNVTGWDISTWSKTNADVVFRTDEVIADFPAYRVAKTAASSSVTKVFTPSVSRIRISGYVRADVPEKTPAGSCIIAVKRSTGEYIGEIWFRFYNQTFTDAGHYNGRFKFIQNEDGQITFYYSFEVNVPVGVECQLIVYIDYDQSTTDKAVVMTPPFVQAPKYPQFRVAKTLTDGDLHVYYKKEEEEVELTNIVALDQTNGLVSLHDVDVHEDGMQTSALRELYCSATLRAESNPMDIIAVLNHELNGFPYVDSLYNTVLCDSEKTKLAPVALYKNEPTKLSELIESLQSGSTVGFRYDDVDKIYIFCDDPNRVPTFRIPRGAVINRNELEFTANLTLYADEVTVNYNPSRMDSDVLAYKNTDYKTQVLLLYSYSNPTTIDSLLVSDSDAINKSKVMLEDLSRTRPIFRVKIHGLSILRTVDLYHIGFVDLSLDDERSFAGVMRMQIIGIEVDTQFGFVTLTLRERVYSSVFADIANSYGNLLIVGQNETALGQGESVIGGQYK